FFGRPNYVEDVLFQLQLQGLTPVLAHPERIEALQRHPHLLGSFVERGMLTQVTAGSITGHFGRRVQRFTHSLLRRGLVHIIASDTHFSTGPRSPELPPGVEVASGVVAPERVRTMVVDTPKAVLDNLPIDVPPPQKPVRPRRWWQFRKGG
ncbi:MAG: CpsB/CapC family capsule biosynthesis tyrosine phosphatase, partial [Dehalococcoidia bacterium]